MTKKTVTDAYYHGAGSIAPMPGPSRSAKTPSPRAGEGRGEGAQPKNRHSKPDLESTPEKAETHQEWLDGRLKLHRAFERRFLTGRSPEKLLGRKAEKLWLDEFAHGGEYNPETCIIGETAPEIVFLTKGQLNDRFFSRLSADLHQFAQKYTLRPQINPKLLALHMAAAKNPCDQTLRQRRGEK